MTITATAIANNSTWPFVTIDQFQQRAASSRALSGSSFLHISPIVTDETRTAWEAYSVANKGWLREAREYQAEKGLGDKGGDPVIYNQIVVMDDSGNGIKVDPGVSVTEMKCKRTVFRRKTHHGCFSCL